MRDIMPNIVLMNSIIKLQRFNISIYLPSLIPRGSLPTSSTQPKGIVGNVRLLLPETAWVVSKGRGVDWASLSVPIRIMANRISKITYCCTINWNEWWSYHQFQIMTGYQRPQICLCQVIYGGSEPEKLLQSGHNTVNGYASSQSRIYDARS